MEDEKITDDLNDCLNNSDLAENNLSIKSILFNNQDDNLKLNNKLVHDYIENLCSLGILKLNEQSKILEKEENDYISSIKQVILKNYNSVINSTLFINELDKDTQTLQTNINTVNQTLPIFSEKVAYFSHEAESISKRWRNASLMLKKHGKILEFLEILQLFDSCLRNSLYDESLKLLQYVENLNLKYGNTIKIISDLGNKTSEWKEIIVNQLIKELFTNDNLDSYKSTVNYLRKLAIFGETEICYKFLLAKNKKLESIIKEINETNIIKFLVKLINVYEESILEIFIQYNSLFPKDKKIESKEKKNYIDFNEFSILFSWTILKINVFLETFKCKSSNLKNDENYTFFDIVPLFDPCFRFSATLSKIGLDLKFIFISLFSEYLINEVKKNFNKSIEKFESYLDNYNIVIPSKEEIKNNNNNLLPPSSLKNFPPLKILCNDILIELNKLLLFISFKTITEVKFILEEHLNKTSLIVQKYLKSEHSSLKFNEKEVLIQFKNQYEKHLLPHIQQCYEKIVSNLSISQTFGLQAYNFTKLKKDDKFIDYTKLNLPLVLDFILDTNK